MKFYSGLERTAIFLLFLHLGAIKPDHRCNPPLGPRMTSGVLSRRFRTCLANHFEVFRPLLICILKSLISLIKWYEVKNVDRFPKTASSSKIENTNRFDYKPRRLVVPVKDFEILDICTL